MLKKHVYLCGVISNNPYVWEWRNTATEWFNDRGIETLDPLRGKTIQSIDEIGFKSNIPGRHFVPRDLCDVKRCDALLCNFLYISPRQMVGSLMELGAAAILNTPFVIVAIDHHIKEHPFTSNLAVDIVPTLEEGMEIIRFLLM